MSPGPHHYREAEKLLRTAGGLGGKDGRYARELLAAAHVHALLAVAAATATQLTSQYVELDDDAYAWNEVSGTQPRGVEDIELPEDGAA